MSLGELAKLFEVFVTSKISPPPAGLLFHTFTAWSDISHFQDQ